MVVTQDNHRLAAAISQIAAFEKRYSTSHIDLASHLAFPLAFTPTLAYEIWQRFGNDLNKKSLNIPWIAVADVLLSSLCREIEPELYEMDGAVRTVLLDRLKSNDQKFGLTRIQQLSQFLKNYIKQQLKSRNSQIRETAKIQHWIALAYSEPNEAAREIALALQQIDWGNKPELVRTASLIDTFVETLADFQPLLIFAGGMAKVGRGDTTGTRDTFVSLGKQIEIAGVRLQIPQFFPFETVTVNPQGEITHRETKQAQYLTEDLGNNTNLEMVYIPGGTFTMGSPKGEGGSTEKPQHQVTIKPFLMGKYPVTQAQWEAVMGNNPSNFKGENRPVEEVSWYDTIEFCARLSQKTGKSYRLPSEAEWEYACRADTTTPFHFGETITTDLANYQGTDWKYEGKTYSGSYGQGPKGIYRQETTPVGSFQVANAFGLYDMHGNVWEWCADPWHDSYEGAPTDGSVWDENNNDNHYNNYVDLLVNIKNDERTRLLRGGSWDDIPDYCRAAVRINDFAPDVRFYNFGFRLVCAFAWTPSP